MATRPVVDDLASWVGLASPSIEVLAILTECHETALEDIESRINLPELSTAVVSTTGALAGDVGATGVAVGDVLKSVVGVKTSDHSVHDFTSEFRIRDTNVINNASHNGVGGTDTTGYVLTVTYAYPRPTVASATGGVAGNIAVPGILLNDTLDSVVGVKSSDQSVHDFTSEFSITADKTINNTGGTATTGYVLTITYRTTGTAIYPARVRSAVLIQGGRLVKRRLSPEGVAQFGDIGVVRISTLDPDVEALIARFLKLDGFH